MKRSQRQVDKSSNLKTSRRGLLTGCSEIGHGTDVSMRLSARGVSIGIRDYSRYILQQDRAAFFQVVVVGEYDNLLEVLRKGDTVIDCGANIGCFTILSSKLVGPTGRVIAVEPSPENVDQLRKNLRLNGIDNVTILTKALYSEDDSLVELRGSGMDVRVRKAEGRGTTRTITISSLIDSSGCSRIRALKMDIEGSEETVFSSSHIARTLEKVDTLDVEVHSVTADATVKEKLKTAGFTVTGPDTERDYFRKILSSSIRNPILVLTAYGRDFWPVASRVLSGKLGRQEGESALGFDSEVLGIVHASRLG